MVQHQSIPSTVRRKPLSTEYQLVELTNTHNREYAMLGDGPPETHQAGNERHKPSRFRSLLNYIWLFEVLSLLLAWVCFAAIITTLTVHRNRPLPGWPQLISINSLIAIFTAIMKAALIAPVAEGIAQIKWNWFQGERLLVDFERFDSASRGPWGSFLLMLSYPKDLLALFGALITVVALAIDPFSQQVLQYYDCRQPITGVTPSVSIATNYTRYGAATSAKDKALDQQMANAIYTGVINPPKNASSSIAFDCQSGNCTFPVLEGITYRTLAMCGQCEDLTHTINTTITNDTYENFYKVSIVPPTFDPDWASPYCNVSATTGTNYSVVAQWLGIRNYVPSYGSWYVSAFDTIMYTNCSCSTIGTFGSSSNDICDCPVFAANCRLYPCVKTYRGNIENFVLNETELSSTMVPLSKDLRDNTWVADTTLQNGKWSKCDSSPQPDADHPEAVYINSTYLTVTNTSSTEYQYYPEGCVWNLEWGSIWAMRIYLANYIWTGTIDMSEVNMPYAAIGSPWLQALFNNGTASLESVEEYIDGLANAITSVMRQYGDKPSSMDVKGTAFNIQTCIRVQWAWLSLPATLLVLGAIFLLLISASTRATPGIVWKSSALAILLHGFDSGAIQKYRSLSQKEEMKDASRKIYAHLEDDQSGVHFVIR